MRFCICFTSAVSSHSLESVLVIEYGYFNLDISQLDPSSGIFAPAKFSFNYTTSPQVALRNRTSVIMAAAVVGGGSTINGMLFDRASKEDYDNWERLGNPGWGWDGLFPYFRKVSPNLNCLILC